MADIQFLRLNDKWALAYDRLQWIVQRRQGTKKFGELVGQEMWKSLSFITCKKSVLLRVLREKGVVPTAEAEAALDALPDTFREFSAAKGPKVAPGELFRGTVRAREGGAERVKAA